MFFHFLFLTFRNQQWLWVFRLSTRRILWRGWKCSAWGFVWWGFLLCWTVLPAKTVRFWKSDYSQWDIQVKPVAVFNLFTYFCKFKIKNPLLWFELMFHLDIHFCHAVIQPSFHTCVRYSGIDILLLCGQSETNPTHDAWTTPSPVSLTLRFSDLVSNDTCTPMWDCVCSPYELTSGGVCPIGYYCPAGTVKPTACTVGMYCETPGLPAPTGNFHTTSDVVSLM